MSGQSRDRRRRALRNQAIGPVERLEGRALLASIAEFVQDPVGRPTDITGGPDGALWYSGSGRINRITPTGAVTSFALAEGSNPNYITTGPDGNLWFGDDGADKIGRITPTGTVTEFALASGSGPGEITTGPDGALWFTEASADKIGRITTTGTITEYAVAAGSYPYGIASGADGNLWFTEYNADMVGKIVPSGENAGTITTYSTSEGSSPRGITAGSDGNLWFAEAGGNNIGEVTTSGGVTEYAIPTASSQPVEIVSGPGGDLFFSETDGNNIGRITTSGSFTEYAVPTSSSAPDGITVGPDHHVWFVEFIGNQVGRLNLSPTAVNDSFTAAESTVANPTSLTVTALNGVLANDTDPEGDSLASEGVVDQPSHGAVTLHTDGSFTYTPSNNYLGIDSFTYQTSDGADISGTATVTINVDAPPVAVNDTYRTPVGTTLTVSNPDLGVQANDTDPNPEHTLTSTVVAQPSHGAVTLNANGTFTYIPADGYHGLDTFTYHDTDSDGVSVSDTATVTIALDSAPVAVNKSFNDVENTSLNLLANQGLLVGATDAEGDPLTAVDITQPSHGTVTVNADGSFSYIPTTGYHGADSFTFAANDGFTDGNTATVSLYVDQPPVGVADGYTTVENTGLSKNASTGVLANDTDTDAATLTASLVSPTSNGTLNFFADGSFSYIPTHGFYGTDSFTYQANDGITDSPITTVSIRVDAPPVGVADGYNAVENTTLTRNAAAGLLANDSDPDVGDTLTATLISNPGHGTVTLFNDGSFAYVPAANYHGTDTFTYKPYDGITNGNLTTVSIRVDAPPVAVNDTYTTALENTTLTVNAAGGVLANDNQAQGEPLTAVNVTQPTHGTVTLNADGSFSYVPTHGFFGTDTFTYRANDGYTSSPTAGTVTIRVDGTPVASADSYEVVEYGSLTKNAASGVLANDNQSQGNPLTASLVSSPSHSVLFSLSPDGAFTYVPAAGFFGIDTFTYKANDGYQDSNTVTVAIRVDAPPLAVNDTYTAVENTNLVVNAVNGVLANDTDADVGDTITAVGLTQSSHGEVGFNADGSFTYYPNPGFFGTDTFTYAAYDGFTDGNAATVTINVDAPPVTLNDSYNAREGITLTKNAAAGVLANDTQAQGNHLTAVLVANPTHGAITLNANGSFTYVPAAYYFGTDTFTYKANDGVTNGNIATVTLTVAQDNAPVAVNDSQAVGEGGFTATAGVGGLLLNDTDADADPLTMLLASEPSHGSLTFNADGSYVYVPNSGFGAAGTDSFTYRAFDGVLPSNVATVTLTFDGTYDPPVAQAQTYSVAEGATLSPSASTGVLVGANDYWKLGLTAIQIAPPSHGSFTLNADGSFTYTPTANYFGADSFSYEANNGHDSSTSQTVTLNVSQVIGAPVAVNDSYAISEATPLTTTSVTGVLANDTDPQSLPLSSILVTNPAHGSVALNADGSFVYTPVAGYFGPDSFTYKDNNGRANSNTATVALTVTQVFYAPVAGNDTYTIAENGTLTISTPGILANDFDRQGLSLTPSLVSGTSHASAFSFSGNGAFNYTPNPGFFGTDSFTYRVNDGHNNSNTATVTITVTQVIQPPVAANDSYAISEATPLTTTSVTGVLANDTDPQSLPLSSILVTNPAHGSVALNADGSFVYTPVAGYFGPDSFTYKDNDGTLNGNTATVALTVTQVFYPPVAVNDSFTTPENTTFGPAGSNVLTNDSDPQSLSLTVADPGSTATAHGLLNLGANGTFNYTPSTGFVGTDTFTYIAYDGHDDSNIATVTITVTPPPPQAPAAADDSQAVGEGGFTAEAPGILANDTDHGVNPLTALFVSGPSHGSLTFNADGSYVYIPNSGFGAAGTDTFTYRAFDGVLPSNVATVTLTFDGTYDPPVAQPKTYTVAEGATLTEGAQAGLLAGADDYWSLPLTAVITSSPTHGTLTPDLNGDGGFTYAPAADFFGVDTFTFEANNGHVGGTAQAATIDVSRVDHAPVAVNDGYTTPEEKPLTVNAAAGLLANDTDADGAPLTAVLVSEPAHGRLAFNTDGSFVYSPDPLYRGSDSFTYRAFDGSLASNAATVNLTVTPVNHPPVAVAHTYTMTEEGFLQVPAASGVLANDTDPDNDPLTAVLVSGASHGSMILNPDGSFVYSPNPVYYGTDSFSYKANDGQANSNVVTVTIHVTPVPPVAVADSYTMTEEGFLQVPGASGLLANDTDALAAPLNAVLVSVTGHGSMVFNPDGSFSYSPDALFFGTDSFTYQASDGTSSSNVVTVTIHVTPVPPVAVADSYTMTEEAYMQVPAVSGLLANDTDALAAPLNAVLVSGLSHGGMIFNPNGSFSYSPNALFFGTDSFSYKASDGTSSSNVVTVTIHVTPVPPVAVADSYTMGEETFLQVSAVSGVLANDTDAIAAPLKAVLVSGASHGSMILKPDGSFVYSPNARFSGTDSFTYEASDGTSSSNVETVTIHVTPSGQVAVASAAVKAPHPAQQVTALAIGKPSSNTNTVKLGTTSSPMALDVVLGNFGGSPPATNPAPSQPVPLTVVDQALAEMTPPVSAESSSILVPTTRSKNKPSSH